MNFRAILAGSALAAIMLASTACGAATPTPRPTTPTAALATITAVPTATLSPTPAPPTATATPTPVPIVATAKQDVNTRKGPGLEYATGTRLTKDTKANVLGKNADGKWLQLAFPDATNTSWVSATFVNVTGPVETLQVIQVAPVPTSTRGAAAPTKPTATAAVVVPAPRGGIGFVYYEDGSNSYVLGNLTVETRAISGIQKLGPRPGPFDVNPDSRTNSAPFAWSSDRSQVVYVFSQSGRPSPDILKYLKAGAFDQPITLDSHLCISSPTWLPDNKRVAYIGMDDNCMTQYIFRARADGTPLDQSERNFYKARPGESLRGLAWGPFVLYVSNASGNQEIWRLNQDGSSPTQVTSDGRENGSPSWNPNGSTFAYYSKQADGSFQIMVRNADGSNPRKLTNQGHNFTPAYSPDGNWIAFMSDRGGRMDVYIMDKNGGQVQLLTDKTAAGGLFPGTWH